VSTGVNEQLRNELARIERPLAHAGFLIGEVRVVDEGSWGRLDAVVEGCNIAGKIQIHLGKKGRISIVPQGNAARAIAVVLEGTGGDVTAPNPSRPTPLQTSNTQTSSAQTGTKPPALTRTADGLSKPKPATRRTSVRGNPGELVVDCSKFGGSLIGPTEWQGVLFSRTGEWQDVFHSPLYERGHNNLGEFLAIIDACQRLERSELKCVTLWSDSKTALSWFRTGKIRTTIDVDGQCDSAFAAAVNDARKWLESANRPKWFAMMSRWDTSTRGENPADFGRK
jgi:ribonuclease HI